MLLWGATPKQGDLFFQVSHVSVFPALGLAGARDGAKLSATVWELYHEPVKTEIENGWLLKRQCLR